MHCKRVPSKTCSSSHPFHDSWNIALMHTINPSRAARLVDYPANLVCTSILRLESKILAKLAKDFILVSKSI